MTRLWALFTALYLIATPGAALESSLGRLNVQEMAGGFIVPWSFGFLPDGSVLVTEREGELWRINGDDRHMVAGIGPVAPVGQGGLLDVLIPRDFAMSRELFFSHAKGQGRGAGTAIAKARLSADNRQLTGWTVIYEIAPGSSGGRHFGSRLVEARDGTLFVTVGDRGDRPSAQDLGRENGSVLRITRDGQVPADNPFIGRDDARAAIWSSGHRNPQGATLDASGQLWVNEHGARGGDEVNRIEKGANYGWPVIAYGRHYSGLKIGEGTQKPGLEQPVHFWDPSIAPSGMLFHEGRQIPDWAGDAFVGSLKFDYIARLSGNPLREVEQLTSAQTARVRDIRQGPDGAIWFLSEGNGALYRITAP